MNVNYQQVGQLKEKIATEKGWEASSQRLIYSGMQLYRINASPRTNLFTLGKILADANTIESYKIEEKGFIVCMITKVSSFCYFSSRCRVLKLFDSRKLLQYRSRPLFLLHPLSLSLLPHNRLLLSINPPQPQRTYPPHRLPHKQQLPQRLLPAMILAILC